MSVSLITETNRYHHKNVAVSHSFHVEKSNQKPIIRFPIEFSHRNVTFAVAVFYMFITGNGM